MVEPSEYIYALFGLILVIAFLKLFLGAIKFTWKYALTIALVAIILITIFSTFV